MLFSTNRSIKIDKRLYDQLAEAARRQGYSSTDELIQHVLQRAVADSDDKLDAQRAEQQLRGLGYLE
jgi:metal-responsive CopG/Arc/MetJ family transcriptional regulator